MEQFWEIIQSWDRLGQFVFFVVVIGGFLATIHALAYYIIVLIHGWPPEHVLLEDEEE